MSKEESQTKQKSESLEFQAEVQQLLHILAHSLYTEKEIFLRELISNASDALHRLQFEMLTNRDVHEADAELTIHIDFDEPAKTLTISDTGIGMTRNELVENLGTIAHSGAMAFLKQLEAGKRPGDIIGQFGVGFYSVFMVAEKVKVTSRSYLPEAQAFSWTSTGENTYTLTPAEKTSRGTRVEIQLKEDAGEFAAAWRLEQIIKKHSDFISFPIYVQDKLVNQQIALWRKPPQEVTDTEYRDFYRQLTFDMEKPLLHLHIVTDVPVDIRAVLYVPRQRERTLHGLRADRGLKLYTRNVLIQEDSQELLPAHLRFVEGVVDSEDLPLNVSRQAVQSNPAVRRIRKALSGRVLRALKDLGEEKPDQYRYFWDTFGLFIKEGVATDPLSRDDLLPLLRFHTSKAGDELTSLADYASRIPADQERIYYVLGEDLDAVARSPHMDYFRTHDLEVLYLVDPLDGFMVQSLREFEGKSLQNVDDAGLELPSKEEQPAEQVESEQVRAELGTLIGRFKQVLGERVLEVRASRMLTDSPCRLVTPEGSPDRDLQRIRRLIEQDFEIPAKILELNPAHELIERLSHIVDQDTNDARIDPVIEQLYENLLLLDGLHPNPSLMVPRIQTLLEAALQAKA